MHVCSKHRAQVKKKLTNVYRKKYLVCYFQKIKKLIGLSPTAHRTTHRAHFFV